MLNNTMEIFSKIHLWIPIERKCKNLFKEPN